MTRPTRDQWAMSLAIETSKRATCLRRSVGCVLLSERGHVLATGYNGVAAGQRHCNEVEIVQRGSMLDEDYKFPNACPGASAPSGTKLDACQAIHAEQNALLQCRDVYDIHTCYVTVSPCITCVKLLLNTGCKRIVFIEEYSQIEGRALWTQSTPEQDRAWPTDPKTHRQWIQLEVAR